MNVAKDVKVTIVPSDSRRAEGPPCSACGFREFYLLGELCFGVERAECVQCGEMQYVPSPPKKDG